MKEQLKSYKTVEQIAKKHRMEVSDIQKQLDMGAPIEHEHTKNKKLAVEIALQHLDEFPDYYTRLKKMEASAKKEHKKFKDVKEGLRDWYGDSQSKGGKPGWVNVVTGGTCASDESGEGVPKCVSSEKRASMTKAERLSAARRKKTADKNQQSKSGAAKPTYVSTDKPEKKMNEEKDIKGKGSGKKDACYTKVKSRYDVWPSAYASGALVKCRKVGAANWGNKSEEVEISLVEKILGEEMKSFKINKTSHNDIKKQEKIRSKTFSNDNEAKVAKSKLRPSAAVSLPLNNEYQPKLTELVLGEEKCGKGMYWCNTNKECKPLPKGFDVPGQKIKPTEVGIGKPVEGSCSKTKKGKDCPVHGMDECPMSVDEACWTGYKKKGMKTMFGKKYPNCVKVENVEIEESVRIPARTGNIISVMFNWRGKTYGTKIFFPQIGIPTRKDVEYEIQKIYPDCRILTFKVSEFVPGQPLIYVNKSMNEEIEIQEVAAWQRKEGKNPEGGLNAKGVASYRKENPGSKLQTAVTTEPSKLKPGSKDAKRRKSFCARMSGVDGPMKDEKGRPTRKALALRKWNCN